MQELSEELISSQSDSVKVTQILEKEASFLTKRRYPHVLPLVELLLKLKLWPHLALQIFKWRREKADADADAGIPMVAEEYAKGITIAGRVKDVDLAVMLFSEASKKGFKTSSIYNALMGAYMYNDKPELSQSVFRDLKSEISCGPTIVTYNILLTVFGRLTLVEHMEEIIREIDASGLPPNANTYNHIIAGYITDWRWEKMERAFQIMESGHVKPDLNTHLLMLRGYANSGNLRKMENTYELVKLHVNEKQLPLIRAMICAYCKSSEKGRVPKVETLLKLVPENEYRPWLNVLLIRLYAEEDLMDGMENFIRQAFEHNTSVITVGVMRSIITTYFRCNALARFTSFLKQAEFSGWRICRSLYHCKMVMFSAANRLEEMENVLEEMSRFNLEPTKKTFLIMYKAYSKWGQYYRRDKLLGTMCKYGFEIPLDALSS